MDYQPPGYIQCVGDERFPRYVIRDRAGKFWAGESVWSGNPSEAVLFYRELDAVTTCNRHCLGDEADTFTATVVLTVHAGRWTEEELAAHLRRHRKFCIAGHGDKGGLLLEILPGTLKKVEP
ncbi:MAG: hypothetical protein ACLQNE_32010 [Thermoguttaceae bacterium]